MYQFKKRIMLSAILAIGTASAHAANVNELFLNAIKGDSRDIIYESTSKAATSIENVTPVPINPYTSMVQPNQPQKAQLPLNQQVAPVRTPVAAPILPSVAPNHAPVATNVSTTPAPKKIDVRQDTETLAPLLIETRPSANVKVRVDQVDPSEGQPVPYIKPTEPILPEKAPNNPYITEPKVQYPAPPRPELKNEPKAQKPATSESDSLPNVRFIKSETSKPTTWEPLRNVKEPMVVPSAMFEKPKATKVEKPEIVTSAKADKAKIKETLSNTPVANSQVLDSQPGSHVSTPSKLSAVDIEFIKLAKKESDIWAALDLLTEDDPAYMQQVLNLNDLWAAQDALSKKTGVDPKSIDAVVAIQAASHKRSGEMLIKKTKAVDTNNTEAPPKDILKEIASAPVKTEPKTVDTSKVVQKTDVAPATESKSTDIQKTKSDPVTVGDKKEVAIKIEKEDPVKAKVADNKETVLTPSTKAVQSKPVVLPSRGQVLFQSIEFGERSKPESKTRNPIKNKNMSLPEQGPPPAPAEVKVTPIPDVHDAVIKTSLDK